MSKKGGYVIVDLKGQSITAGTPFTLDGVTARLNRAKTKACLLSGFAIGDEEKRDVFVDLQKTEDGYVALFGQYTLTIEDDEVTITDGGVLIDNIVDSNGNKRFVSGNITKPSALTTATITYGKWNLSGNHLMIVLAFKIDSDAELTAGTSLGTLTLPEYISDKLVKINPDAAIIDVKSGVRIRVVGSDWQVSSVPTQLRNSYSNVYSIIASSTVGYLANDNIRIEYDLLID